MSGQDDNDDGTTGDFSAAVAADWDRWRETHPIRAYAPAPGGITVSKQRKPPQAGGTPWTTYRSLQQNSKRGAERVQQERLFVPYATLVGCPEHIPSVTTSLRGGRGAL